MRKLRCLDLPALQALHATPSPLVRALRLLSVPRLIGSLRTST